jgi:DNA-binding HxlR family transcriptional regulator
MSADDVEEMSRKTDEPALCELFQRAAVLLARRWNPMIVGALLDGVSRFTDLRNAIPGISDRLLSERLKELEAGGIVTREVTPCTPVRIEYGLTDQGRDLAGVLDELRAWSERWGRGAPDGTSGAEPEPAAAR